jgi:signal recognition particle subunit SRP72
MASSTKTLTQLLAQTSIDDHDELLRSANASIKKNKTDLEAQHARTAALLHLDRFEDAVKVFEDVKGLQDKATFEYAYALYKTGNAAKAVEVAQGAGVDTSRGMQHVLAQAVRSCFVRAKAVIDGNRHTARRISHKPHVYTAN